MFFFLLSLFIVLDVIWWRLADGRLRTLRASWMWRTLLVVFIAIMISYLLLSVFWPFPLRRSGVLPVVVHTFIYLWHFIAMPMTVGLYILRKAGMAFRRPRPIRNAEPAGLKLAGNDSIPLLRPPVIRPPVANILNASPSRRQILSAAAMAIPPLATGITSVWSVHHLYGRRLRSFTLTLPQLPRQLDGLTIAHVSDTHIGKFLNPDRLPAIAEDINKLDADFITFTGDLIDLSLDDLPHGVKFLRSLRSRCGMVVCEGNHDVMQSRGDFEYMMRDAEIPILLGHQQVLPWFSRGGKSYPVQFLAVPWNPSDDAMANAVEILRPEMRSDAFPILLAHHPHSFDAAARSQFPLTLSGHTHGGQIMLTSQIGLGSLRFRYTSGLYEKNGSSLIVNNGIGNWFPLRINAPAELVHITLRSV